MSIDTPIAATPAAPHAATPDSRPLSMDRLVAWLSGPARRLHGMILEMPGYQALGHVSLSVYDPASDMLWAFSCRSDEQGEPDITEVAMTDAPSLALLADDAEPRIVQGMAAFGEEGRCHTGTARASDSRSCMTAPIHVDGRFLGFVIFGASAPNFFGAAMRETLATFTEAFGILIERGRSLSA